MKIIGYSKCQCGAITINTDIWDYSCKQENLNRIEIYTPVSAQTKEERADGEAKIVFKHLRWAII